MNYQELVDKCKQAYAEHSLSGAYYYWEEIHNLLFSKLDKCTSEEERHNAYSEFHNYMEKFTNNEVYDITDYGKAKAERQRERKIRESMNYKSLYALTKNENMKVLDEFLEFYEWGIVDSDDEEGMYCIYDMQLNEYKDTDENNGNKTLDEVIERVLGRAIDYEYDREIDDEYVDDSYISYLEKLYAITKNSIEDYSYFKDFIDELKEEIEEKSVCLVCGKKKDDYQSAYCDECWEEEKKRLGIEEK